MIIDIFYTHNFVTSLLFTIAVETLILFLLLRFVIKYPGISAMKIIATGMFVNFATVPYVWFVFPAMFDWPRTTSLMYSEPFVFVVEAIAYRVFLRTSVRTSFFVSLVCNGASYFIPIFMRQHGMWVYW